MQSAYRAPQVEIVVQYPNPNNSLQQGAALVLDGLTQIQITRNEEPLSDRLDFQIANGDGRYSPLRS